MVLRSRIIGCGGYLPDRIMTNDELSGLVDTTDEWITGRSGIRQRHIAAEGELTSDLAVNAAKAALKDAGISVDDIDLHVNERVVDPGPVKGEGWQVLQLTELP